MIKVLAIFLCNMEYSFYNHPNRSRIGSPYLYGSTLAIIFFTLLVSLFIIPAAVLPQEVYKKSTKFLFFLGIPIVCLILFLAEKQKERHKPHKTIKKYPGLFFHLFYIGTYGAFILMVYILLIVYEK